MHNLQEIIGLPVILSGKCIGYIMHAQTDGELTHLHSVWIRTSCGICRRIARKDIFQIGERVVGVHSAGSRDNTRPVPLFRRAISTDGTRLGAIIDAVIDDSLNVIGLWLSCGYPDELRFGRTKIDRFTVRRCDGAVLIPTGEEDTP